MNGAIDSTLLAFIINLHQSPSDDSTHRTRPHLIVGPGRLLWMGTNGADELDGAITALRHSFTFVPAHIDLS